MVEEQVQLKVFQVQEEEIEGVLEEEPKEGDVDPEPGRQLAGVQVDWDTEKKKIRLCEKHMYYINILWQQEQVHGLDHHHDLGQALYLELVEPKGVQVQEEEAKEGHVDPELGRQLEDVQVDWDTGRKKKLDSVKNTQIYYINILWQQEQEQEHGLDHDLDHALYVELVE